MIVVPEVTLIAEPSVTLGKYDGIILVAAPNQIVGFAPLQSAIEDAIKFDPALKTEIAILKFNLPGSPVSRLVYSPTGPIDVDYDDVRIFETSAVAGVKRALRAGIRRPLLILEDHPDFENAPLVTLLGALQALYTPLQVREADPSKTHKVDHLGVYTKDQEKTKALIKQATVLEFGRRVARDIGESDPERMSPLGVEHYVSQIFHDSNIKVNIVSDVDEIEVDYPLFEAVNRAASVVDRHRGRIIFLEYVPPERTIETLFLVGKGVTYDTGGADVKIGGGMVGMSRDKCGAAAVAGFMAVVFKLQLKNVRVVAGMSMVRNSIGSNSYVADEVITARSGARVRVVNTDAEGRMVMADVLCKFKELALKAVNPHLFTIATLTGHAGRAVGSGYSIVMDNGPARVAGNDQKLRANGDSIGDCFEISRIRREDFIAHKGRAEGDTVVQGGALPSTQVNRGHQGPAAFLIMASGLDKHGSRSDKPLKYSHLDIAASAGDLPGPATGAPILAFAKTYLGI